MYYNFLDKNPFPEINYYRLKMVDIDDSFEFSNTVTANVDPNNVGIEIFPNPAKESINIQLPNWIPIDPSTKIKIFNSLGKVVRLADIQSLESTPVDISELDPGIYFVEISVVGNRWTKRFFKL